MIVNTHTSAANMRKQLAATMRKLAYQEDILRGVQTRVDALQAACASLREALGNTLGGAAIDPAQAMADKAEALKRINAERERKTAEHNAERARLGLPPVGVVRYPPWCTSKAAQQAYLKQLSHGKKIAANRRAKEYSSKA